MFGIRKTLRGARQILPLGERRLASVEDQLSDIKDRLSEIALFANNAKNGIHYHMGDDVVLTVVYTGQILAVDRKDLSLSPHLILKGIWEMEQTRYCEALVSRFDNPVIFDVGANFGWYGIVLSRFSTRSTIHFFEANPSLIPYIKKSVLLNGKVLDSKINHNAVAGSSGDNLALYVPELHKGSASLAGFDAAFLQSYHENIESMESLTVQSVCIDDYCRENEINSIDFMKIDVEGYEADVLAGGQKTIASSPRLAVMMEWNRSRYPDTLLDLLKVFPVCEGINSDCVVDDLSGELRAATSIADFEAKVSKALRRDTSFFDLYFRKS